MTIDELPKLIEPAQAFFHEANLPGTFAPQHCIRTWRQLLESGIGLLGWQPDAEGNYQGGIGGVIVPDITTGEVRAQEMFWYVMPGLRGLGMKLIRWFETMARARGVRRVVMIHLESLNKERLEAFYVRSGYAPLEHSYIKELIWP